MSEKYYQEYYSKSENKKRKLETNKAWRQKNLEHCREYAREYSKKQRTEIKLEIIELLGGKCSNPNCLVPNGCRDIRCLQVDHVHGNGKQQRRRYKGYQDRGSHYYRDILRKIKTGSKDYQLLCANCNWIKRYKNGETGICKTAKNADARDT